MIDRCPHCTEKPEGVDVPFDYTVLSGLDPEIHRVELQGIVVRRCACGLSPVIPNVEGLHATLALALINRRAAWDASAYRYVRKTLGLTQERFAQKVDVTPVTVSKWENRGPRPDAQGETAIRVFVLAMLLEKPEFQDNLQPGATPAFIKRLLARLTSAGGDPEAPVHLMMDPGSPVPAWIIPHLSGDATSAQPFCQ